MKLKRILVLLLVVVLVLTGSCSAPAESVGELISVDSSFPSSSESVDSPANIDGVSSSSSSAQSTGASSGSNSSSAPSSISSAGPPYPKPFPQGEPLYTTEEGNVWLVSVGYIGSDDPTSRYEFLITLPDGFYVVGTVINNEDSTKYAELISMSIPDGQSLAELLDYDETSEFYVATMAEGGYTLCDGREICYSIAEHNHDAPPNRYVYMYNMKISDEMAIEMFLHRDDYNPEEVKPLCEQILASIQLYEG